MRKARATGLLAAAMGAAFARLGLRQAERLTRRGTAGPGAGCGAALLAPDRWSRLNHRGEPVTLLEGPAYAAGAATAVLLTPGLADRTRVAAIAAALGAGALGGYDDLYGNADRRGLRGHLGALRSGEVTTGGVKLVGIGALGLACGALVRRGSLLDKALAGVVVAGAANAVNLLDLRPGRAVKAAALASAPALLRRALDSADDRGAVALGAAGLGAAAALLPEDLGESAMLGDAGANALGALLGVAAAAGCSRSGLVWRAAALTAVTLASEKVSFTRVIAACPPLDALDRFGRRPAVPAKLPAQTARAEAQAPLDASADAPAADPDDPPHDPDLRGPGTRG
jgi:UDP-N-acetylmuramyl pentapeptide phosphotransferase/UDP-N-acetylglucosamine-1-phosphate transferase